jgi:hypothetical protein
MATQLGQLYYEVTIDDKRLADVLKSLKTDLKGLENEVLNFSNVAGKKLSNPFTESAKTIEQLKNQITGLKQIWEKLDFNDTSGQQSVINKYKELSATLDKVGFSMDKIIAKQVQRIDPFRLPENTLGGIREKIGALSSEKLSTDINSIQRYNIELERLKKLQDDFQNSGIVKPPTQEKNLSEVLNMEVNSLNQVSEKLKELRRIRGEQKTTDAQYISTMQKIVQEETNLLTIQNQMINAGKQEITIQQKLQQELQKTPLTIDSMIESAKNLESIYKKLDNSTNDGDQAVEKWRQLQQELSKYGIVLRSTLMEQKTLSQVMMMGSSTISEIRNKMQALSRVREQENTKTKEGQKNINQINAEYKRLERALQDVGAASKNVNRDLLGMDRVASQIKGQLGAVFSIYALQRFSKELIRVRGQYELQQVSLRAILRDTEKADQIFAQVVELGLKSPFTTMELVGYTKQLAAYRIETEDLYKTTKMLSDVSAGLGVDMQRIILAYGQVRAASVLRGQEVRQFTEAGIPLVEELANKFSILEGRAVSTGEVFQKISKRMVSFGMVKEIFEDLTKEGGMFYNMQEIQSETLYGQVRNISDAIEKMFNQIGQGSDGILKGTVGVARSLVDNWETVGKVVLSAAAALGTYKMMMIAANILAEIGNLRAFASAFITTARNINIATAAQTAFNKVAMKNVYAAIAAVLVAIGLALYNFSKRVSEVDKALENIEKSANSSAIKLGYMYAEIDKLGRVLKKEQEELDKTTKGTDEYAKASEKVDGAKKKQIQAAEKVIKTYGDESKSLDITSEKLINEINIRKKLTAEILKNVRARAAETEIEGIDSEMASKTAKYYKNIQNIVEKAAKQNKRLEEYPNIWAQLRDAIDIQDREEFLKVIKENQELLTLWVGGEKIVAPYVFANFNEIEKIIKKSQENKDKIMAGITAVSKKETKTIEDTSWRKYWDDFYKKMSEEEQNAWQAGKPKNISSGQVEESLTDFIEDRQKEWKEAEKIIEELGSSANEAAKEEVENARTLQKQLSKLADIYGYDPRGSKVRNKEESENEKKNKAAEKALERLQREYVKDQNKLDELLLNAMEEGINKRYKASENAYEKEIRLIEKERSDLDKIEADLKGAGKLTPENQIRIDEERDTLDKREIAAMDAKNREIWQINKETTEAIQDMWSSVYEPYMSELDNQILKIETKYREHRENILKLYKDSEEQQIALAEAEFNERRDIEVASLDNQLKILDAHQELEKQKQELANKSIVFEAEKEKKLLEIDLKYAELRLKILKKLQAEGVKELETEIESLEVSIDTMNKQLDELPSDKFYEVLDGIIGISDALGGLSGDLGKVFSSISKSAVSIKKTFEEAKKSTKDYADLASTAVSGAVDIFNMMTTAYSNRKQAEKEYYQNAISFAHDYALALNEQLRTMSEQEESGFVTNYSGRIEGAFKAREEAINKYREAIEKLNEGQAKVNQKTGTDWSAVGQGAAAGAMSGAAIGTIVPVIGTAIGAVAGGIIGGLAGLFGGKKKNDIFAGLMDVFPKLVDEAGNLNKELAEVLIKDNQLDDATKQLVQNAIDWDNAVEEADKAIGDIVTDLAGDLGNSIKNALVEAFKAGEDAGSRMFTSLSESLGNFLTEMLFAAMFEDIFKTFKEEMKESMTTGDQDIMDDYDRLMDALDARDNVFLDTLDKINKNWKERTGEDLIKKEGATQQAAKGGYETMSQDVGLELNGRFTDVQMKVRQIVDTLNANYSNIDNIRSNIEGLVFVANNGYVVSTEIRDMMQVHVRYTKTIMDNTSRLEKMESLLSGIKQGTDTLK